MYEDLNQIAQLKFNKEIESISKQTRDNIKEMQNEYAALSPTFVGRSGQQDASIGRVQIDGSERLVRALFQIWVDLIKKKNAEISRPDIAFITSKIEGFALTQRGHLRKAFSTQRMGAVVNLLLQEAEMRMHSVTADLRRDLEIVVRENEAFPKNTALPSDQTVSQESVIEHNKPRISSDTISFPHNTVWAKIYSWGVIGTVASLVFGTGFTFMTSGHGWTADGFFVGGTALFLVKFCTWEDARREPPLRKWTLLSIVTVLFLGLALITVRSNHSVNRLAPYGQFGQASADPRQPTDTHSAPIQEKAPPSPQPTNEKRVITTEERVKVIIAGQLQVDYANIKPEDDFEVDLGAQPSDVYFLMRSLEQEYNITIPTTDSRNLHTVRETIAYIEMREQRKKLKHR